VRRALAGVLGVAALLAAAAAEAQPKAAPPAGGGQPVTVDSDKMERFGKESLVIFTGNVVARHNDDVQYADRLEVYFDEKESTILRTVSTGNVRIVTRDRRTGTARRAEYYDLDQRVVLKGNARIWQDENIVTGETITIFISQDRMIVEGGPQERTKGIFYSRDDKKTASATPTLVAAATAVAPPRTAPTVGDGAQPVTVDSDKMERFGKESLVIFTGNVIARHNNNVQYADRLEVYFDEREDKILRTVSTGNVRIQTRDCRTGTARRAEYYDLDQRVVLKGNARIWQDENIVSGETITIFISQDRMIVEGGTQERTKGIFYSRDDKKTAAAAPAKGGQAACAN
jgi:lipopolysaccharide export system protein LptA